MSAHDELQRQLADSVAARARVGVRRAAPGLGRWWRSRLRGGALLAAVPAAFVIFAVAATLASRGGTPRSGESIARWLGATSVESSCAPCRSSGGQLHAPLSEDASASASTAAIASAPAASPPRAARRRHGYPNERFTPSTDVPPLTPGAPVG